MKPLFELLEHGQSYWLDNLSREMIQNGELRRRVEEEGLRGVTSNPAIFHKAISAGTAYDEEIERLVADGATVSEIYESLVVADIREACDVLRPVFDESGGADGFVSLEVSPRLIHDTGGSIEEGRHLWAAVDRPNLMIKIPGTPAGVPAIEELLYDGINVNVTLLFDVPAYDEVARAHLRALRRRFDDGRPVSAVASVASFFLSRIDVLVDSLIGHRIDADPSPEGPACLLGAAGIASAKFAYRSFQRHYSGPEWDELASGGARVQRLLWASTSTKNPLYDPVRYVEPLIGRDTVNTMPEATIEAFAEAGTVKPDTVAERYEEAVRAFEDLDGLGIDMVAVAAQLVNEGADKFIAPFDRLLAGLARRRRELRSAEDTLDATGLADALDAALLDALAEMRFGRRLFAADPSLWSADAEVQAAIADRLGWLDAPEATSGQMEDFRQLAREIADEGFRHVLVLGMGGSSLAPAVLAEVFPPAENRPRLLVLDDIDPDVVRAVESRIDPVSTLFVVSSKSGTTVETLSLFRHFHGLVEAAGVEPAGSRFVAVTDPGTPLVATAHEHGFRRVVEAPEDVGGRFSALTAFGMLPAVLAGLDAESLLASARELRAASSPEVPLAENPALGPGVALGRLAEEGRDKLTILADPPLSPLAAWLEQLVAESTGKHGTGILPILDEPVRRADTYPADRLFLHLASGAGSPENAARVASLEAAGHPVVRVRLDAPADLGREFMRWELGVAAAAVILGVNPFDEPDVNEAKERARRRLASLPEEADRAAEPEAAERGLELYLELAGNGSGSGASGRIAGVGGGGDDLAERLLRWLDEVEPADYVAVLAYFGDSEARDRLATRLRGALAARTGAATTFGRGPRYLHSTGQLHKGGRPGGAYLVLTADSTEDVPVPDAAYGLAQLRRAQALGDAEALAARGRHVARVNLGWYVEDGLARLAEIFEADASGG